MRRMFELREGTEQTHWDIRLYDSAGLLSNPGA